MKLHAERDSLLAAITAAARVAPQRAGLFQSGLHLAVKGDDLTVTGSDPDIMVTTRTTVDGDADGATMLSPRLVSDIVRAFDPGTVHIDAGDSEATISSGRSHFTVRVLSGVELVALEAPQTDPSTLDAQTFARALRQVTYAALRDDSRAPQLCGILLAGKDDRLRLVATDSYRLAIRDVDLALFGNGDSALLPSRALTELQRLIDADAETVSIVTGERSATLIVGSTSITTRLIAGAFPDYERLIPSSYPVAFTADRDELLGALKRVRTVLGAEKAGTTPVRLDLSADGVDLRAVAPETGDAVDRVDGKLVGDGDAPLIAFNPGYLADALDAIDGESVTIECIDQSKPASIHGDDIDQRCLLMPVRTS